MTITDEAPLDQANAVSVDLYRDIHKGIRAELFAVTGEAGRLDPASTPARVALADYVRGVVDTLEAHAAHEDAGVQPVLEDQLPDLAVRIHDDHERLAPRAAALIDLADEAAEATGSSRAEAVRHLYLELADFTGTYLLHQDVEERIVLPALRTAIGPREILAIHGAIIASIPPDQMATVSGLHAAGHEHRRPRRAARRHAGRRPAPGLRGGMGPGRLRADASRPRGPG